MDRFWINVGKTRELYNRIDFVVVFLLLLLGVLAALVLLTRFAPVAAGALIVASASALTGGLLGFIFAVPRRIADHGPPPVPPPGSQPVDPAVHRYDANTSLEEICDWLTKIIVGVGLVEAQQIAAMLDRTGRIVGVGAFNQTAGSPAAAVLGTATIIAFAVLGFLMAFLWFRQNLMIAWSYSHAQEPTVPAAHKDAAPPERVQATTPPPAPADMPEQAALSPRSAGSQPGERLLGRVQDKYAELRATPRFPDDWCKGMFGGQSTIRSPTRKLDAVVTAVEDTSFHQVAVEITSSPPATGQAAIFLHNTFPESVQIVPFDAAGRATLKVFAWGAFTVGVLADDGATELELDLATLPGVPERFAAA